jgi:hypothetical protein
MLERPETMPSCCDLVLHNLHVVTYESKGGFYHNGWFATYQNAEPIRPDVWVKHALGVLVSQPTRFTDDQAVSLVGYTVAAEPILETVVVWRNGGLQYPCRLLETSVLKPKFSVATQSLSVSPAKPTIEVDLTVQESEDPMAAEEAATPKQLSEPQKARIRKWAVEKPDATTREIAYSLRLQNYPERSIMAVIAMARRR